MKLKDSMSWQGDSGTLLHKNF